MRQLRAPWRHAYVTSKEKPQGCVLCAALLGAQAPDSLVVHVAEHCFVVMNLYPYGSGHLMVAPVRHIATLEDLDDDESVELAHAQTRAVRAIRAAYSPDGINLGTNLGRAAGAVAAEKLRGAGVTTYAQIAAWSPDEAREIALRLEIQPGRIASDDWVGQARALLDERGDGPAAS